MEKDAFPAPQLEQLTPAQKKEQLYQKQKALLDTFLEHHAISRAQYDKSLGDLSEKMGILGGCPK